MHKVKNADFEEYRKYREDLQHGRILTPEGLRVICQANDKDPEKIGQHFLEMYGKFKAEGVIR